MTESGAKDGPTARLQRHRTRRAAAATKRLEVSVPDRDTGLVKALAGTLRAGGTRAEAVRAALTPVVLARPAQTGAELVAFLRASPLADSELDIARDRGPGRAADFD